MDAPRVSETQPPQQRLEIPTAMWIAIGLVALVGLARNFRDPNRVTSLDYLHDDTFVVRIEGQSHEFPLLGIRITPPQGWTYLALRGDRTAHELVFVNEKDYAIAKVQPFRFVSWPPFEAVRELHPYQNVAIEWFPFRRMQIGRLHQGDVDVVLIVMAHLRGSQLNPSVQALCDSIELLE